MGKELAKNNKATLEKWLSQDAFQDSLKTVLPKHLTPERIVKMALVAASRQPKLYQCSSQSFLQAVMKSAELGLDCSGTLGAAYLVPYYNGKIKKYECQFMPGYRGLIELARRSGNIARIESRVVYANDKFEVSYGTDMKLEHKPALRGERGDILCVYAIAELTDGCKQIELMTLDEVNGIRDRSKAKDSGPWVTDYSEMARKTVVRRLCKYLPLSPEIEKALEADDQQFDFQENRASVSAGVEACKEQMRKSVESEAVEEEEMEDEAGEEPAEKEPPSKPDVCKYMCTACDHEFDEPKGKDKNLCPNCLKSGEIVARENGGK